MAFKVWWRRQLPILVVAGCACWSLGLKAQPAPYSVPWQLRPTVAGNAVRLDSILSHRELPDGSSGWTSASMVLASYKVLPGLAPFVRLGYVHDATSSGGGGALTNPALGATYVLPVGDSLRLAFFLGLTVPVGMGGGNTPAAEQAAAARAGILSRSAMDNAMFAVNDFTVFPGVGLSFTAAGFTAQVEATVLQLTRVRGEAVQADASKTNFTSGLHAGYSLHPTTSVGVEVRYQRWLTTPASVSSEELRDNLTVAAGPRFHFKAGGLWLRPGIAVVFGLDAPMTTQKYTSVQVDLPISF